MSDPTTEGLEATPAEIEGMVRNLCAYALGEPDPILRYEGLTHQQVLFEGMVEALRRERGKVVADLVVEGLSVTDIAEKTSLGTVVKVRKLISVSGQTQRVQEATAARKATDRNGANGTNGTNGDGDGGTNGTGVDKAAAPARPQPVPPPSPPSPPPLPPHLAAPTGKRLLTPADRAALGLPVDRPIESTPPGKAEKKKKKKA